jgi:hypothetical protein
MDGWLKMAMAEDAQAVNHFLLLVRGFLLRLRFLIQIAGELLMWMDCINHSFDLISYRKSSNLVANNITSLYTTMDVVQKLQQKNNNYEI